MLVPLLMCVLVNYVTLMFPIVMFFILCFCGGGGEGVKRERSRLGGEMGGYKKCDLTGMVFMMYVPIKLHQEFPLTIGSAPGVCSRNLCRLNVSGLSGGGQGEEGDNGYYGKSTHLYDIYDVRSYQTSPKTCAHSNYKIT